MVSRLKNGQTVGFLTLQTIKIKDNVAYLPEVSALAMGSEGDGLEPQDKRDPKKFI